MKQHQAARIATVIERKYPELFAKMVEDFKAELTDTSLIPALYAYYQSTQPRPLNLDEAFYQKLLFFATILDLFDPGALYYGAIATKRLSTTLAHILGYNHRQSISSMKTQANLLVKNSRFKKRVKDLSEELKRVFNEELLINT